MIPELMRKRENGKQSSSMIPELMQKREERETKNSSMIPELMQKREERETKQQYDSRTHAKKRRTGNKAAV